MKKHYQGSHLILSLPLAGLSAVLFSLGQMHLQADPASSNIATGDHGAYVIYSTPLKGGASPNGLIDGHHSFSFANKGGEHFFVVDLGKSYKLDNVGLKFQKPTTGHVYIVNHKPGPNETWLGLIGSQAGVELNSKNFKGSFHGAQGEFLIFVTNSDPGEISGFYVTEFRVGNREELAYGRILNGIIQAPLGEVPIPGSHFVPPASP
jgi:hypothetical protein